MQASFVLFIISLILALLFFAIAIFVFCLKKESKNNNIDRLFTIIGLVFSAISAICAVYSSLQYDNKPENPPNVTTVIEDISSIELTSNVCEIDEPTECITEEGTTYPEAQATTDYDEVKNNYDEGTNIVNSTQRITGEFYNENSEIIYELHPIFSNNYGFDCYIDKVSKSYRMVIYDNNGNIMCEKNNIKNEKFSLELDKNKIYYIYFYPDEGLANFFVDVTYPHSDKNM